MPLLSNIPCNLIARHIIETLEQSMGWRRRRRKRRVVGFRRKQERVQVVNIGLRVEEKYIFDFSFSFMHEGRHKHTYHMIMSCPIVSHISPHLLHQSLCAAERHLQQNECSDCSDQISQENLIIEPAAGRPFEAHHRNEATALQSANLLILNESKP